jgi:hypothetical protein
MSTEITERLRRLRMTPLVTCKQIAAVKPRPWGRWILELAIGGVLGLFVAWMFLELVNVAVAEVVKQIIPSW